MDNTFSKFLLRKLQEYENQEEKRVTLNEFAEYLRVSRPLVSNWLSGNYKPSLANAYLISEKLGDETFDALGMPRPDPRISEIKRIYDAIPEDDRDSFVQLVEELARDRGWEPGL